ncbi:cyclic lactone autoinducer peptide [Clostridium tarantellae]|uniref:Cyclic lactone autoinducer peptide n=1 Tax=Clostridium tarantellae TaxID=39493 RepID=A0A6I1MRT3_9CLOT|nr:cyclic lactone autoinducer peptide [Clostridium tarantellae]MPQ44902.1 cyclic lactone autoinducer peptide [Clostridium tarantellae]
MKNFKSKLLLILATITTLIATSVATSACLWYIYQPEEPECLKDE